ncbi:hypothetical protein X474_23890 [Dethiosulfatarculus sandiegensis]|uniref:Uncharacterized protein n=1 Tax=Dethiosulfatarculus sandiegensis TaxID=1429043 RepID=A0A0D2HLU7_9BACT|nr:hypothetical protein X474_23890 [Dethiosulfatarculus sandiegensis]
MVDHKQLAVNLKMRLNVVKMNKKSLWQKNPAKGFS